MSQTIGRPTPTSHQWAQIETRPVSQADVDKIEREVLEHAAEVSHRPRPRHDGWLDFLVDLGRWETDPTLIDNGDNDIPSREVFQKATAVATKLYLNFRAVPTFMVPSSDGGIVFERHDGDLTEKIIVDPDGSAEYIGLRSSKMFLREPFSV